MYSIMIGGSHRVENAPNGKISVGIFLINFWWWKCFCECNSHSKMYECGAAWTRMWAFNIQHSFQLQSKVDAVKPHAYMLNAVAAHLIWKAEPKAQRSRMQSFPSARMPVGLRKNRLLGAMDAIRRTRASYTSLRSRSGEPFICGESIFSINYKPNGKCDWVMCRDE